MSQEPIAYSLTAKQARVAKAREHTIHKRRSSYLSSEHLDELRHEIPYAWWSPRTWWFFFSFQWLRIGEPHQSPAHPRPRG